MSLIYNGTTITALNYNGTSIQSATYNGTSVFTGIDPTKSSFTETEFIALCNATLQAKMTIGATVTLTNTNSDRYLSTDHVYRVIGVNHQDIPNDTSSIATDSVDLYIKDKCVWCGSFGNDTEWINSNVRSWLNGTYINGFTNVSDLLKTMNVSTNGSTTSDKAKLLSCAEIGDSRYYIRADEGTKYEVFSSVTNAYVRDISGNSANLTRTKIDGYIGALNAYAIYTTSYKSSFGWAPVIRF